MNRAQRAAHQRLWWVLLPLLLVAVALATAFPSVPPPEAEVAP